MQEEQYEIRFGDEALRDIENENRSMWEAQEQDNYERYAD